MSKNITIRHFGRSDGVQQGFQLSLNVLFNTLLASLGGFGEWSLILGGGGVYLFTLLLETPLAYRADTYGWRNSVKLGICCVFGATSSLVAATLLVKYFPDSRYHLFALLLYCLFCAFNHAFFRSSYPSAYLEWYQKKEPELSKRSSLFIDSFNYSILWKVLCPLVSVVIVILLSSYGCNLTIAVISAMYITYFLRYLPVMLDLDLLSSNKNSSHKPKKERISFAKVFISAQGSLPDLLVYAYSWLIRIFFSAFLLGKLFHLVKGIGFLSLVNEWTLAAAIALGIFWINNVVSGYFFAKIRKWDDKQYVRIVCPKAVLLLASIGFFSFVLFDNPLFRLTYIIFFTLVSLACSDAMRLEIESEIDKIALGSYTASWMAAGNLLCYLTFALMNLSIILIGDVRFDVTVSFAMIAIMGAIVVYSKKSPKMIVR